MNLSLVSDLKMRQKKFNSNQKKGRPVPAVLSPEIITMIDKITQRLGISRSEFIRICVLEKLEFKSIPIEEEARKEQNSSSNEQPPLPGGEI